MNLNNAVRTIRRNARWLLRLTALRTFLQTLDPQEPFA